MRTLGELQSMTKRDLVAEYPGVDKNLKKDDFIAAVLAEAHVVNEILVDDASVEAVRIVREGKTMVPLTFREQERAKNMAQQAAKNKARGNG